MMGNFIKTRQPEIWREKSSVNEFSIRFPSDDETGRKLTGKDLQIDGINQHD